MKLQKFIRYFKNIGLSGEGNADVNVKALSSIFAGDESFKELDYHKAINQYSTAIKLEPNNHYPLFKRGKCFQLLQQYDEALEDFFRSNRIDNNFENIYGIAECYFSKKEYLKAVNYFKVAKEQLEFIQKRDLNKVMGYDYDILNARLLNKLGECYYQNQQLDNAIDYVTQGIQENPNCPDNYSMRGIMHLSKDNRMQALSDLKNAARLGDSVSNDILAQM